MVFSGEVFIYTGNFLTILVVGGGDGHDLRYQSRVHHIRGGEVPVPHLHGKRREIITVRGQSYVSRLPKY